MSRTDHGINGATSQGQALSVREDFSGTSSTLAVQETASTAVAAQAKAMVEARYVMAMRRPRQWDQVRQDLLKECRRPSFAHNKSAYYRKPIGKGVEGLGIRFVEVALRCMTNVLVETSMIFEDESKEVHRVSVTDLESNVTYPLDVRVTKTVERSQAEWTTAPTSSSARTARERTIYTVPGTEDDISQQARARRFRRRSARWACASSLATCRTKPRPSSSPSAWTRRRAIPAPSVSVSLMPSARSA